VEPLDFKFINDRYDFELQRKEQLTASLNLPVGILGGLGSLLALMTRSFTYADPVLTWIFLPLVGFAVGAFVVCLIQFSRAFHRQRYTYLPLLGDLESARKQFLEMADVMAGGEAEVIEAFNDNLRRRMIDAADRNTTANDARSGMLHWGRVWLFAVLCLAAIAGIMYVADQMRSFNARSERSQTVGKAAGFSTSTSSFSTKS
jgi:hypothetical protein